MQSEICNQQSAIDRLLYDTGLLLLSDTTLPSVATIVAGGRIRGSWWGHPKSHQIFHAARRLASDADVIAIPLVRGKVTFVHRRLWPAIAAIGGARDAWQTRGLSRPARALLTRVERAGELEASGDAARDLADRLLVLSREVHTERGAHAKVLEAWDRWASRAGVAPLADAAAARRMVEEAARALGPRASVPWQQS